MTNLATKKQAGTGSVRRTPAIIDEEEVKKPFVIVDANGQQVPVDEAKMLGDGYVLIRISTSLVAPAVETGREKQFKLRRQATFGQASKSSPSPELKAAPSMRDLPEIADGQIMRLLEKIRAKVDAPPLLPAGVTGKARTGNTAAPAAAVDPLAENKRVMEEMRAQEKQNRENNVLSGALLKPAEFLDARRITRQALSKAVKENRIFFFAGQSRLRLYPAFFADPNNDRAGLEKVSKELGTCRAPVSGNFSQREKCPLAA